MKRPPPIVWFLSTFVAVVAAILFSLAPYAILAIVLISTFLLARHIFSPKLPGVVAASRVVGILLLVGVGFGQVYFLLPSDSFKPEFQRSWLGFFDAVYYSLLIFTSLASDGHEAVGWTARMVQLSQIVVTVVLVGFGLNYLIEHHREEKTEGKNG
jgi:hypothetical protein